MNVYFVRHGESQFNALQLHQHSQVPLSETGIKQAKAVAKRFAKIPLGGIIACPYLRTRQTAEEIQKVVQKEITYSDLVREIKRPTEIEGKSVNDPRVRAIRQLLLKHMRDPEWHYADEDNFYDLKKRVQAFLAQLESSSEENLLVVTHGLILRVIVSYMLLGEELDAAFFAKFDTFFKASNTGITLCKKQPGKPWRLLVWNDHSHL